MTAYDDFDRTLAGWFEADAQSPAPAGNLERVLDATRRRSSRRAWLAAPGSHWVGGAQGTGSSTAARSIPRLGLRWSTAFFLLVVISALVGGTILVGGGLFSPSPVPVRPSALPVEPSAPPVKPSPPPAGHLGHLAYGLDGSIYAADWNGRNPVRIARGAGGGAGGCGSFRGEGPMWSPDGRHLAYRSAWVDECPAAKGGGKVFISDPAGNVVASFPGTGWRLSWSPDSTRLATSVDLGHTFGIYGLDGVRQALLTVPLGYEVHGDYDPRWSPDGTSLLMPIAPIAPYGPSEIWELPIDGGTPRRVPDADPRSHSGAVYVRDGARTAFIASDSASLVIAEADGTELRVLPGAANGGNGPGLGEVNGDPSVSPTGDRVAFIWSPGRPYPPPSAPLPSADELRVVDVASGAVTTLVSPSGGDSLSVIGFSPEGDRILFSRWDPNGSGTALSSVRVDGSDPQLLVAGTGWGDWQSLPAGR